MNPFAALLRRYSFAYTASHDFSVCDDVMVDDYELRMGQHVLRGRDSAYKPATAKQYRQFPGLGFTVHAFICNGDRAALHFSEHGWSVVSEAHCAWQGISMYRWNGTRLLECRLEQDYYARRRQLVTKAPDVVMAPDWDPWLSPIHQPNPDHEALVRNWLCDTGLDTSPAGSLDDEYRIEPWRVRIEQPHVDVVDMFSAGQTVVFGSVTRGVYGGGLPTLAGHEGKPASLYATGFVTVEDGTIGNVRAVTDRLGLEKRLTDQA
jgi:predicted ester cyclase